MVRLMRGDAGLTPLQVAEEMGIPQCQVCDVSAITQDARGEAVRAIGRRVAAGHDVRLLCWCYPRACHADGIADMAREHAKLMRAQGARKRLR